MAVKKVTLKNNTLPFVQIDNDGPYYAIRYRIISEDRNRFSHWSPIYRIDMPPTSDAGLPYTTSNNITGYKTNISAGVETITVIWSHPETFGTTDQEVLASIFAKINTYDIWTRWNVNNTPTVEASWEDWKFFATVSNSNFTELVPTIGGIKAKYFEIAIQIPTLEKILDNRLSLFTLQVAV